MHMKRDMRNKLGTRYKKMSGGFALIELAIALSIISIIFASMMGYLHIYSKQNTLKLSQEKMATIKNALAVFVANNGRLPCVASRTLKPGDPDYQQEGDCDSDHPQAGTVHIVTAGGQEVRIGSLPVRALNLPDSYYTDVQGDLFTYAVTEELAGDTFADARVLCDGKGKFYAPKNIRADGQGCVPLVYYTPGAGPGGAIDIIDVSGNSVLWPVASASYVVVSAGKDRVGAYTGAGALFTACKGSSQDIENCNDSNAVFRTAPYSEGSGAEHFDDMIIYQAQSTAGAGGVEVCNRKLKFYAPTTDGADTDGCVAPRDSAAVTTLAGQVEDMQKAILVMTKSTSTLNASLTRIEDEVQKVTTCGSRNKFSDGIACY